MHKFAGVVVEAPLSTVYHYRIPAPLMGQVREGMRVTVPFGFGNKHVSAFVVELSDTVPFDEKKAKEILDLGKGEVLASADILQLAKWIAEYYRCGWGEVLAAAVPVAVRLGTKRRDEQFAEIALPTSEAEAELPLLRNKAPRQADALTALLIAGCPVKVAELERMSGASRAAVVGLEKKGIVSISAVPVHRELASVSEQKKNITLSPSQAEAVAAITAQLDKREYATDLLWGDTGSGKTEVYIRALEHTLAQGRTGIVLVPEISLTPQTVERFRSRVGDVAVLHSNMAAGERAEEWRRLRRGDVRVVIGARSAIFSPLPDLGLIIVDEEHERTFKQDSSPRYHARDVATVRASFCGACVILGSATPCLESYNNTLNGKYSLLRLPERVGGGRLPDTQIIDMRAEWAEAKYQTVLSRKLEKEIHKALAKKEQVILFLNRRGFNTWIHCTNCTEILKCPNCDISLTFHRGENTLRCHYCGYNSRVPQTCPECSASKLRFAGSGTERVEDEVAEKFPGARLLRMDSDTMTSRDSHAVALSAFARGEYDILLGTQMIAKGLDFPNVTLIGVLSADGSINLPDFRAPENTFQLVTQVVGRSGRGERPGLGIIQAYDPRHFAVQMASKQDYLQFAEKELKDRQMRMYPPYGRIARVLVRGPQLGKCQRLAKEAAEALRQASKPLRVLGPVACSIARIQDNHRLHILVKADTPRELSQVLDTALSGIKTGSKTRLDVDVDPVSLL